MTSIISQLKDCMVEHLRLVNHASEIGDEADLTSLGLDSMAATNLMIDIEDAFDVQFPDEMLTPETFHSAASLAQAVGMLVGESQSA